jgi:hypothetical protein
VRNLKIIFFILFLVSGFVACKMGSHSPAFTPPLNEQRQDETAPTLGKMTQEAHWIATATVEEVQNWKDRKDWFVVTLKPIQILKGSPVSSLKLLYQKLFPNEPPLFVPSQKILIFLNQLPPYTAYQELRSVGVSFEVLGGAHGVVSDPQEQSYVSKFVVESLKLDLPLTPSLKNLYLHYLQHSPSKILREDLSQEIFHLDGPATYLSTEDLRVLSKLVTSSTFPDEGKTQLVRGISQMPPDESNSILKGFFCLSPSAVCLQSAQTLESRGVHLPVQEYSEALEKAPPDLKLGLFAILGRHKRVEAYPLFEKALAREKDEKSAAAILEALGDLGNTQAETLCLLYAKDTRYYVRLAVVTSLGKLKSEKGIPVLEEALKTPDPTMVTVAAQSLQEIDTPEARKTLSKYYEKEHHGYWEPTAPEHFLPPHK